MTDIRALRLALNAAIDTSFGNNLEDVKIPVGFAFQLDDALREQEPLTIHDPGAICPNCKWPLYPEDHPNYCGNCGKAVKWDADD